MKKKINKENHFMSQQVSHVSSSNRGISIAALVCGIVCFFFNPLYLVCLAAIVLGIVGLCKPGSKSMAGWGLGLGIIGGIAQFALDLLITIFSFGLGFFSFFL